MFDIRGSDFSIKNVVFESPSLTTSGGFGGLIARIAGYPITLENVGIVNADFKVTASSSAVYVGGFFAYIESNPTIERCFVTGSLTGESLSGYSSTAGGIYARKSSGSPLISYCYTKITSNATNLFGIGPTGESTCYYESSSVNTPGGGNAVTLTQMQNPATFVGWNISLESPWVMSLPSSPLVGMPCFDFMTDYLPVYPIMNLTIVDEETNYVGMPILIKWADDEPESTASDYTLTITNPNGQIVYTNYAKAGSYTLTPNLPGAWRIDYNSSLGNTYGYVSALPAYPDLRLNITPKTAYQHVTEVTVSWDDVFARSPGTNYYLQIIRGFDGIVYQSNTKTGTYTFTPDEAEAHLVKYGCDQDEITDQITVLLPYLTGDVEINGTSVGDPLTITWSFDHLGIIPDTGRQITRYEFDVYEYTSLEPLTSRLVETIKTSNVSGTLEKVYPTAKTFPATSTYYTIQPYVIDDRNQRYGDIPGDYVEVFIYEPYISGYSPSENYTDAETLSIDIDRGSFPAMSGTERVNVTVGLRDEETEEWVFSSKTYTLSNGATTFTLDTSTLPKSPYDRLVKIAYETVQGNIVTSSAEKEWLLKAPPVYPTASWKNPETGKPITSANKNQPVALHLTPGARWSGDDEFMFFELYAYRHNPVLDRYEPYLYNGTADPIMMGSALFGDDIATAKTLTFNETGTYKVCVFRFSYPDMVLQTPPIAESDPLKVTENWFSPDVGANEAGKIFGLDGEAIKLIIGMLIVIGCAAIPPLIFGNSHPMVVLIGGVAGLIIGFALSLIPFWILLLLAIAAIAMVILNVRGGSAPPGGDE